MAHVERVHTGFRVITHIRGRVYRQDFQPKPRVVTVKPKAVKQRRNICLLDADQAMQLETYGIPQPCFGELCRHQHFNRRTLEILVKRGDLRWVGESHNVAAWADARELVVCQSGRMATVQLREVGWQ